MRKLRILFAPQLVQIAESDQADEGPHPAGDIEHQRIDAGEGVHDQTGRAPGNQHDDGARQQVTHDSSLVAGSHDAARLWLVLRKLRWPGEELVVIRTVALLLALAVAQPALAQTAP